MTRRTAIVILSVVVVVVVVVVAALALRQMGGDRPAVAGQAPGTGAAQSDVLERPHSPVIGPASAPVTIVEFFDPACEGCRAYHPYVKQILAAYPREARLVLRYVPFHGQVSVEGVHLLEAAREQGRFEAVLEALMAAQPDWADHVNPAPERAWDAAGAAGLDLELARTFVATGATDRLLELEIADVTAFGIDRTPTFFVNGRVLQQSSPEALLAMVSAEVERTPPAP